MKKHISKWEHFINESLNKDEGYYELIDYGQFISLLSNVKSITPSDKVKIESTIKEILPHMTTDTIISELNVKNKNNSTILVIKLLEDEWFLVKKYHGTGTLFYKCDQLEGLKKLLIDWFLPINRKHIHIER